MSLLGTFLVRSGVLNSVHAFANDPARGVFILGLLMLYAGGAFALFAWRAGRLAPTGLFAPISREGGLVLNNLLLCSIAAVVLVGTLYPMFADLVLGVKISVGPPFFNMAVFPLSVPLVLGMALGPLLAWKRASLGPALVKLWWVAVAAALTVVLAMALAGHPVLPALGFAAAVWLVGGALADIFDRIALFRRPGQAWKRARGLPRATWGGAVAHAGMGVMIAGIAGMGVATDALVSLRAGERTTLAGYTWTLEGVRDVQGPNWTARRATIEVTRDGAAVTVLQPERRWFPVGRQATTEAAIHTNALRDLYAVLGEEQGERAVLRLHHNPLAPWIWFGAAIMALGGALSLSDRRVRVSAPAPRAAARAAA
jgi:cytochrome c-type biogenesis protein CcmF